LFLLFGWLNSQVRVFTLHRWHIPYVGGFYPFSSAQWILLNPPLTSLCLFKSHGSPLVGDYGLQGAPKPLCPSSNGSQRGGDMTC
jgi:hypothetical protein